MKKIKIKSLSLSNFRGVRQMNVDFGDVTTIVGDNGTGKSSIKNAIIWLFTNSDELDRINYKLFDETVEHTKENSKKLSVVANIEIDSIQYELKKEATIGWTRKKERAVYERKGSDNYYFYVDGIEKSATDYKNFIETLICPIDKLKFILNTNYPMLLEWKALRKHFEDVVGEIKREDFTGDYSMIDDLLVKYNYNIDDIKDYLKPRINALRKKVGSGENKGELEIQIEALTDSLPSTDGLEDLQREIFEAEQQIKDIDDKIAGSTKSIKPLLDKRNTELDEIGRMKSQYQKSRSEYEENFETEKRKIQREINEIKDKNYVSLKSIEDQRKEVERKKSNISLIESEIENLKEKRLRLIEENNECKSRVFDGYNCPYCGQELPAEKIEEAESKFNEEKEREHQRIVSIGKLTAARIKENEEFKQKLEEEVSSYTFQPVETIPTDELEAELFDLKNSFIPYELTDEGKKKLSEIQDKWDNITIVEKIDNSALVNMKNQLIQEVKEKSLKLGAKDAYNEQKLKINRIVDDLKESANELAMMEGKKDAAERYDREKASIIYNRVNGNFKYAKVEMTEQNKSGEYVNTCRVLDKNGVDMRVTNTASKVLCGADIALSFAKKMDVCMPLILDDMEKVNKNNLPAVECQLVILKFDYCDLTIKKE